MRNGCRNHFSEKDFIDFYNKKPVALQMFVALNVLRNGQILVFLTWLKILHIF